MAETWAMPEPIRPQPTTPTLPNSMICLLPSGLTGYRPFVRFSKGYTFWILDFGFWIEERAGHRVFNPKSKIQNLKSKISAAVAARRVSPWFGPCLGPRKWFAYDGRALRSQLFDCRPY